MTICYRVPDCVRQDQWIKDEQVKNHPLFPWVEQSLKWLKSGLRFQNSMDSLLNVKTLDPPSKEIISQSDRPPHRHLTAFMMQVWEYHTQLYIALRSVHCDHQRIMQTMDNAFSGAENKDTRQDEAKTQFRLAREAQEYMISWFLNHRTKPYPTTSERKSIALKTGLTVLQVRNWFANMRKRHWKPIQNGKTGATTLLALALRSDY